MDSGDRVLTEAEWNVFCIGLGMLWDFVEADIAAESDETDTGVPVFDQLTAEQKLALLTDVASAIREPAVPIPSHTAANEGAILAVLNMFLSMLEEEVDVNQDDQTLLRQRLLEAVANSEELPRRLPRPTNGKWGVWLHLHECIVDRILWDHDFEMGDMFLDLPPDELRTKLKLAGIDPDYYLATPREPSKQELITARQTLARLVGLPIPDDNGLYPALQDLYHDLFVGPVKPEDIVVWEDHPWIEVVGGPNSSWDCDFKTWKSEFSASVPTISFQVRPTDPNVCYELPREMSVENFGEKWVVKDGHELYWCGLIENAWTDAVEDESVLLFSTELDARAAFSQASQLYDERAQRHIAAGHRIRIANQQENVEG